jgi:hypothetical protein
MLPNRPTQTGCDKFLKGISEPRDAGRSIAPILGLFGGSRRKIRMRRPRFALLREASKAPQMDAQECVEMQHDNQAVELIIADIVADKCKTAAAIRNALLGAQLRSTPDSSFAANGFALPGKNEVAVPLFHNDSR